MAQAARKCMGDVPIAYIEGVGGVRVGEDELVGVGKNDVSVTMLLYTGAIDIHGMLTWFDIGIVVQGRPGLSMLTKFTEMVMMVDGTKCNCGRRVWCGILQKVLCGVLY